MSFYEDIKGTIKDFQQTTIEHAYTRLKENKRFLVADEVGLGKTMIAKGIIAKTIDDQCHNIDKKIDIIYITTNELIASQNITTLAFDKEKFNMNNQRLSLLMISDEKEQSEKNINIRSFTIGTSLDPKGTGKREEREFIVYLLRQGILKGKQKITLWKFFKAGSDKKVIRPNNENPLKFNSKREFKLIGNQDINDKFIKEFNSKAKKIFENKKIDLYNLDKPNEKEKNSVIKELRIELINLSLQYLNPSLIILDEFNRFFHLMKNTNLDNEENSIIKSLFNKHDTNTLLLSATPYKLLDCSGKDDHYNEFYALLEWLKLSDKDITYLQKVLQSVNETNKAYIEETLLKVMCRTERLSFSSESDMVEDQNEWVKEHIQIPKKFLDDYKNYTNLKIPRLRSMLKSTPNPLNYMEDSLDTKKLFNDKVNKNELNLDEFKKDTKVNQNLHPKTDLLKNKINDKELNLKNLIWLPPISPYVKIGAQKKDYSIHKKSKILIFSKWDFAPNSIIDSITHKYSPTSKNHTKGIKYRELLINVSNNIESLENPYSNEISFIGKSTNHLLNYKKDMTNDELTDRMVLLSSPSNVIYRSLKKEISNVVFDDIKEDIQELADIFVNYLGKDFNYDIIKKYQPKYKHYNLKTNEIFNKILIYCLEHDIQAMFDEYFHIIFDEPKIKTKSIKEQLDKIKDVFRTIFELRPNEISLDNFDENKEIKSTRFAMRIGKSATRDNDKSNDEGPLTAQSIKEAFNSPFAPFVLATTSIGQEGLDFHTYCHQIWHWDVPSNPVDLEQRDGRLKRYKNYAVRKNIAIDFSDEENWSKRFEKAKEETKCDFQTFWLYKSKDQAQSINIERYVPVINFTKDYNKYEELQKQLKVYRKVLGKNKHDLDDPNLSGELMINLRPKVIIKN